MSEKGKWGGSAALQGPTTPGGTGQLTCEKESDVEALLGVEPRVAVALQEVGKEASVKCPLAGASEVPTKADLVVRREILVFKAHAAAGTLGDREAVGVDLARQLKVDAAEDRTALSVLKEQKEPVNVASHREVSRAEQRTIRIEAVTS